MSSFHKTALALLTRDYNMTDRIEVGILGATGTVGQELVLALTEHPWFVIRWLAASERSAGRRYADATPWRLQAPAPAEIGNMMVQSCTPVGAPRLVFSGLDAAVAGEVEGAFATAGHTIVSNARSYRMDDDVPLLVPEINPDHLALLKVQTEKRKWAGRIITNPNCSTIMLAMALAPLLPFGVRSVMVSTLQAISGAGYPGIPSLDIVGNVIPYIAGEEEKIESETRKILGCLKDERIEPHPVTVSAQTTRVPVLNGHTELVSVALDTSPGLDEIRHAFKVFTGRPQAEELPNAPRQPIVYLDLPDRPQPRLDVNCEDGMGVTVGRLRACPVLDFKFVVHGHNTIRGAAGAALLNAELLCGDGLV